MTYATSFQTCANEFKLMWIIHHSFLRAWVMLSKKSYPSSRWCCCCYRKCSSRWSVSSTPFCIRIYISSPTRYSKNGSKDNSVYSARNIKRESSWQYSWCLFILLFYECSCYWKYKKFMILALFLIFMKFWIHNFRRIINDGFGPTYGVPFKKSILYLI